VTHLARLTGDFGLATILKKDVQDSQSDVGTYSYRPPEMVKKQKYNNRVDIWSLGCVLLEVATGIRLYQTVSGMIGM